MIALPHRTTVYALQYRDVNKKAELIFHKTYREQDLLPNLQLVQTGGFFPVAAQNFYRIGHRLSQILNQSGSGRTFSIVAENRSPTNVYIAKAMWNGKPYRHSWFTHDQLMAGGAT
jgi:hypothetical protein